MSISDRLRKLSPRTMVGGAPLTPMLLIFGLNAVAWLDVSAFNILVPNIRDAFHLGTSGVLEVIGLITIVGYLGQSLVGYYADRWSRVKLASFAAVISSVFTLLSGLAINIAMLVTVRSMAGVAKAVNDPTHNSLLADYYEPSVRSQVYGLHQAGYAVGVVLGSVVAGLLAFKFGWRAPFLVFWIPPVALGVLALILLKDPVRGEHERRAMGASPDAIATEEEPPTLGEAWRICSQVKTLRRLWTSLPYLAAGLFGISSLTSIYYKDVFGVDEFHRGLIAAGSEPARLIGIVIAVPIISTLMRRDPGWVLRLLAVVAITSAAAIAAFAIAPTVPIAVAMNVVASCVLGMIGPAVITALSLVIPPRARALGFSIGSLYLLPGILVLVILGLVAQTSGIRVALLVLVPVFLLGAFLLSSAGSLMASDIEKVRASTVAQAKVLLSRRQGHLKLLVVKDLDVRYDGVQVLFDVNFEVDEGEIIALLGTNGAGKSTLLKAIGGLIEPYGGAIVFDGRDTTYGMPNENAARGMILMPGGRGVFPGLTVHENLTMGAWIRRRDSADVERGIKEVLELFPVLAAKLEMPAASLSGGQQQMLSLGLALLSKPRLVMIDELSLGLAPAVVEQLLQVVKSLRDQGVTVILVEQSVNLALTVADTAYFMEKGKIQFHGPTAELLHRPDILRSVFLEGAAAADVTNGAREKRLERPTASTAGDVVLETRGLTKAFAGVVAVHDVSIQLRAGEILGIIGPNGAGKTTLFDLVSGFLMPDSGSIWFDQRDVTALRPDLRSRLGLARSFQDARLFGSLTVHQAICIALDRDLRVKGAVPALLNLPQVRSGENRIGTHADELIELMGLNAFRDKFVWELSTGSRRIVDLACQVGMRPTVILFDEPSSGIAQKEAEALGPVLLRMRDQLGASLLVIEHDMPLINAIADRLVALDLGRHVAEGSPNFVLNHPQVVASYLGSRRDVIERSGRVTAGT